MTFPIEKGISPQPERISKPLPISYRRTYKPNEAADKNKIFRLNPPNVDEAMFVRTDPEIEATVKLTKEKENWYTTDYWREKGMPREQIEFSVNGSPITIYNWSSEKPFTEEHAIEAQEVLEQLVTRFPQLLPHLRWILIDNVQIPSAFDDNEKFPTNGKAENEWQTFKLFPRGMELSLLHRVAKVSNFKGTLTHELTHLFSEEFQEELDKNFQWGECKKHPEDWERKKIPNSINTLWVNRHTGDLTPSLEFPLQREQYINYYAALDRQEDVPESMVAYIWDPDLLQNISETKMSIFEKHDTTKQPGYSQQPVTISHRRVPSDQIKLPEVQPETVHYYIVEPELMGVD